MSHEAVGKKQQSAATLDQPRAEEKMREVGHSFINSHREVLPHLFQRARKQIP